jgi:hypothetical protein
MLATFAMLFSNQEGSSPEVTWRERLAWVRERLRLPPERGAALSFAA